jgi:hypothetical protein
MIFFFKNKKNKFLEFKARKSCYKFFYFFINHVVIFFKFPLISRYRNNRRLFLTLLAFRSTLKKFRFFNNSNKGIKSKFLFFYYFNNSFEKENFLCFFKNFSLNKFYFPFDFEVQRFLFFKQTVFFKKKLKCFFCFRIMPKLSFFFFKTFKFLCLNKNLNNFLVSRVIIPFWLKSYYYFFAYADTFLFSKLEIQYFFISFYFYLQNKYSLDTFLFYKVESFFFYFTSFFFLAKFFQIKRGELTFKRHKFPVFPFPYFIKNFKIRGKAFYKKKYKKMKRHRVFHPYMRRLKFLKSMYFIKSRSESLRSRLSFYFILLSKRNIFSNLNNFSHKYKKYFVKPFINPTKLKPINPFTLIFSQRWFCF